VREINEKALIDEVQRRLARKFTHVPAEHISAAVTHAHAHFEQSPVRDVVPLLVERRAREALSRDTSLLAASG
jgi:hypothetical protein